MDYREAIASDIPVMARIRVAEDSRYGSGEEELRSRMLRYFEYKHHPQYALTPRVIYTAWEDDTLAGYVAGHLTRRFQCDGELQWIYVAPRFRGTGAALQLLHLIAKWFAGHKAARVCVDVEPANARARTFYERHGARTFAPCWLIWDDIRTVLKTR